jgi:hypothetical protein
MSRPKGTFALLLTALTLSSGGARADARVVAARVLEQWRLAGAQATVVPTRFLFDEESQLIAIPPEPDEVESECTHVAVIGARGLSFRARLSDVPMDPLLPPEPSARAASTAGVLELRRCGRTRPQVRHIVLSTEAGRGAVEVIVGRSDKPLPSLSAAIP